MKRNTTEVSRGGSPLALGKVEMETAEVPRGRHREVNESGQISIHPGYTTRTCSICLTTYLTSVDSKATTCKRFDCKPKT